MSGRARVAPSLLLVRGGVDGSDKVGVTVMVS